MPSFKLTEIISARIGNIRNQNKNNNQQHRVKKGIRN